MEYHRGFTQNHPHPFMELQKAPGEGNRVGQTTEAATNTQIYPEWIGGGVKFATGDSSIPGDLSLPEEAVGSLSVTPPPQLDPVQTSARLEALLILLPPNSGSQRQQKFLSWTGVSQQTGSHVTITVQLARNHPRLGGRRPDEQYTAHLHAQELHLLARPHQGTHTALLPNRGGHRTLSRGPARKN